MKKLLLSAAVTAALFAGQASAAIPTVLVAGVENVNFSATTGVSLAANLQATTYFSGSSAATPFLESSILNAAAPNTKVFKYVDGSKAAITYYFSTGLTPPTGLVASKNYAVHKRDKGGSVTAVLAASGNAANIATVTYNTTLPTVVGSLGSSAATCTNPALDATKAVLATCTVGTVVTLAALPTGAVSVNLADVDAAQFASTLNGATATNLLATLALPEPSSPVATQVFGVAVNLKLRDAMQRAMIASGALPVTCAAGNETEACMPSFTKEDVSALFATGRLTSWDNLRFGGVAGQTLTGANPLNLPGNNDVHICSRTAGSGSLAIAQLAFENAPCTATAEAIQSPAALTIVAEAGLSGAQKLYHATTSAGELENCLETMDGYSVATPATPPATMVANGTFTPVPLTNFVGTPNFRWAVGILNTDRNVGNTLPYRFVKINGVSPSAANVANGKYTFWSELSTVGTVPTAVTNPLGFGLLSLMQNPATIAKANVTNPAFGITGYLATAANATFDAAIAPGTLINAAFDSVRPVNPFTHANGANTAGSVNHCRVANVLSGAKALPGLN